MVDNTQSGMPCSEFDALLMEAVEGKLTAAQSERFRSHADSCGVCGPLFADAKSGFAWLQSLEEVEPPANLLHNILAATSELDAPRKLAKAEMSWSERLRAGVGPVIAPLMQPRLAGTFAMAFFSLSLLMNVAGIKVSDIAKLDLRPSAIQKTYYSASSRVIRYYENLRVVYEFQSKAREIREAIPMKEDERKDDGSKPERKQNQKRDDNMTNRPNNSERNDVQRNDARRYRQENGAITPVSYTRASRSYSLKPATFIRATRNDRRTA